MSSPRVLRLRRPERQARVQIAVCLGAYLAYGATRWLVTSDRALAVTHARDIRHLERRLGVAVEASVQRAFDCAPVMWLLAHAYLAAQVVVVPAVLIWLYRANRRIYVRLRDTVLATWMLALPVFWLFPVAPPRLSGIGILDTISGSAGVALNSRLATSFTTRSRQSPRCTAASHSPSPPRSSARPGDAGRGRARSPGRQSSCSPSSPPAITSCSTS